MPRRSQLILGVLLLLAFGTPARADSNNEEQAEASFRVGAQNYERGNYRGALEAFQRSLALSRRPSTLFNIAQCYRQMKNLEQALIHYKLYLEEYARRKPGQRSPHQEEVEQHIARLSAELAAKQRRSPATRPISSAGSPRAPAGAPSATTPPPPLAASPAPRSRKRIWTWVTGATAVAVTGIAIGLGVKAKADHDRAEDPSRTSYDEALRLRQSFRPMGQAATALYVTGGVLAITSVVLYFVEGRPSRPIEQRRHASHWRLQPLFGSHWGAFASRSY